MHPIKKAKANPIRIIHVSKTPTQKKITVSNNKYRLVIIDKYLARILPFLRNLLRNLMNKNVIKLNKLN